MRMTSFCVAWFLLLALLKSSFAVEDLIGKQAPDFALPDLSGKTIRLSQFRGKVIVLVFWAFWCDTWKGAVKTMNDLRRSLSPSSVQILCVAVDPVWKEIGQRMNSRINGSFPILLDKGSRVRKRYKVNKVPTILLLDKNGFVRIGFIGCPRLETLKVAVQQIVIAP
ncbi:MAG: hypothetical protein OGMRLDGQ_000515 [Candidatus Fervidibacter sp.]|jgi:peroxiredoxin